MVAKFEDDVKHNDLGHVRAGTVSFEYFWLTKWYNIFRFHEPSGNLFAYYINISMPPILEGNTLSYIDLDIDVVVWPGGKVDVLDRDDFENNQVKYVYPIEVIQHAETALKEVLAVIHRGALP
jgi:protein associated with RNAse G/E